MVDTRRTKSNATTMGPSHGFVVETSMQPHEIVAANALQSSSSALQLLQLLELQNSSHMTLGPPQPCSCQRRLLELLCLSVLQSEHSSSHTTQLQGFYRVCYAAPWLLRRRPSLGADPFSPSSAITLDICTCVRV
ncbi:hypothetical protein L3X38_018527 [Prunus dulcis]|uniref:Uncharacterized protein n=1 Tax=Prunus dulcis TaxID=3755 RepID=A0AAD4W975_PRUDU|nr:hypothetical protein L3X38_018527 [Prunus dulcis]